MKFRSLFYLSFLLLPYQFLGQGTACTLGNYMAATRIPITSFPYTALSAPSLTVSQVIVGCPSLGNSTYNCGTDVMAGASPAWWLNAAAPGQSMTYNFSSPVTSLTFLVNGTNSTEVFYIVSNSPCALTLSNYCSVGYTASGGTLTAGATAALGSIITVNNPGGATQYIMTHNGLGAGSRVTLLDCFVKGTGTCILPIELSDFNANCSGKNLVELNWKTSTERGNDYFTIERSKDAMNWQSIGEVEGAGSSYSVHQYSFTDKKPLNGTVYYRLKQTDLNKFSTYSGIIPASNCDQTNTDDVVIYPNPSSSELTISGNGIESFQLFNTMGNEVFNKKVHQKEDMKINVSELPRGIYFLKIAEKNYKIVKE